MANSGEKIVIQPRELSSETDERIVIASGDLVETVSVPPPTPTAPAGWRLAVSTLVPFWNAWVWWRLPLQGRTGLRLARVFAVALATASIGCLVGLAVVAFRQPVNWIERVAETAERSVVMIQCGDAKGTGFVVAKDDARCLILTNKHVVGDAQECLIAARVVPPTPARVAGRARDESVDLALLVVSSEALRTLGPIASYESIRTGQQVVAVGHPLGLDYTITEGIISAKRSGILLQTSAPINPGNSGGPLINNRGEVVGVNTMTIDPSEGHGLGFAFRADLIHDKNAWEFTIDISGLL